MCFTEGGMASRQNPFVLIVAVAPLAECASDKQPRTTASEPEKVLAAATAAPAPVPAEPTPAPSSRTVIRIDAGSGKPYTDAAGNVWLPDRGLLVATSL